jgi:GDSL-like Lipase/Acylhydrolase family
MPAPFRMVVLGDSILWGQGLRPEDKATTRLQRWLAVTLGRPVTVETFAHSRAVIAPDERHDQQPPKPGEVPSRYPSVTAQTLLVPNPESVDLVVIDGGINDMGAQQILNPLHVENATWIAGQAAHSCGRMRELLTAAVIPRFIRAVVVVTGYYPLVSEASDPLHVIHLVTRFCPEALPLATAASAVLLGRLSEQSTAWADASDAALSGAVAAANALPTARRRRFAASAGPPAAAGLPGAVFAPIPFRPEHCYAAPATRLWRLDEHDSMVLERRTQCLEFAPFDVTCPVEAAFHPNRDGAQAYAEALTTALREYVVAETSA